MPGHVAKGGPLASSQGPPRRQPFSCTYDTHAKLLLLGAEVGSLKRLQTLNFAAISSICERIHIAARKPGRTDQASNHGGEASCCRGG
jgi:hypothetical protein